MRARPSLQPALLRTSCMQLHMRPGRAIFCADEASHSSVIQRLRVLPTGKGRVGLPCSRFEAVPRTGTGIDHFAEHVPFPLDRGGQGPCAGLELEGVRQVCVLCSCATGQGPGCKLEERWQIPRIPRLRDIRVEVRSLRSSLAVRGICGPRYWSRCEMLHWVWQRDGCVYNLLRYRRGKPRWISCCP